MAADVRLFHIAYSDRTAASCPPGMQLLDNLANERPDWWEYWPIRRFLQTQALDEQAYYGFLSPKFASKTGLSPAAVRDFVAQRAGPELDACLFSPQPDVGMFFENVFVGGDLFDPGFLATAQAVLAAAGWQGRLDQVLMDSRDTVFSNYLVARPRFWRQWLQICECVFLLAERPDLRPQLHQQLNHVTGYGGQAQRKIFVIEGITSLLCALAPQRCAALSPFAVPWFSVFSRFRDEAVQADGLKIAARVTGQAAYLDEFRRIQAAVLSRLAAAPA